MRGEVASRSGDLGRPLTVDERDHQGAESGQNLRSLTSPQSRAILAEADITHVVQAIFNGTITNDKFCMSRLRWIHLVSAHPARRDEVPYPSEGNEMECFPQEDTHETTAMGRSAFQHPDDRRQASMGSSLPVTAPLERTLNRGSLYYSIVLANLREGAIQELALIGGNRDAEKGFVTDVLQHETSLFTVTIVTPSGPFRNL
jgi:hypothetical protein